ncbi:MAG: hypothetical protein KIS87_14635, partial [Phycisphaeraceae bacterium]|nr:hypothetical protein [Phycisphaeraceae bacterium]
MSPIDHLLKQALHEIQSPKATPGQQAAWARIAEHALRCLPGGEERIASALATAAKVFGSPEAVYRLVEGVQVCESDGKRSDRDRVARWVTGLADKAIRGEHWATFAELACHAAILLNAVERDLPPEWERALRAALEAPDAWISLYMFAHHYIDTFKPRKKSAPDWLHLLHSDQRLYDAVDRGLREAGRLYCSACKRMTYQRTLSDDDALAVYDALLKQALREIRSTASGRAAWGRIAEHALSCLPESEERIADALATAGKALDSHECVRRLVEGVRVCVEGVQYSDDDRARTRRWGASMADRAIRGERWATFAELAC